MEYLEQHQQLLSRSEDDYRCHFPDLLLAHNIKYSVKDKIVWKGKENKLLMEMWLVYTMAFLVSFVFLFYIETLFYIGEIFLRIYGAGDLGHVSLQEKKNTFANRTIFKSFFFGFLIVFLVLVFKGLTCPGSSGQNSGKSSL